MSEMKPLLDGSIAPELEELLRSAELDAPAAAEKRRRRIIAAVGATSMATSVPAVPTAARFARVLSFARWGVPLLGLAIVGLVAVRSVRSGTPATVAPATTAPVTATTDEPAGRPTVAPPPAAEATPVTSVRVQDLPSAAASATPAARVHGGEAAALPAGRAGADAKATTPAVAAASPKLDDELALIDAARAALAAGRAEQTLGQLGAYRSMFAEPHFADEADTLEIQALAALGRNDEARRKAERFLLTHKQSPYAQRVRSAVGLTP